MSFLGWAVNLPENWEAKSLRSVAHYVVSSVDKVTHVGENPVRLCNYVDVYHREFISLDLDFMHATASEAEIEKFGLRVDDVLITKDSESWDDIGVPALVRQTSEDLVCGYHLALIRVFPHKMTGAFLFRCLQAKPIQVQLELAANGVTRFGLPKSGIGMLKLPVPPLPRQRAIAKYLNRETALLDALTAAKERMLSLLSEKRQALIAKTVTRDCGSTKLQVPLVRSNMLTEESQNRYEAGRARNYVPATGRDGVNRYSDVHRRRLKYAATINDDVLNEDTEDDYELQYVDIGNAYASGSAREPVTYQFKDAPSRARRRVRDGDIIISCVRTYLQAIAQIQNPPTNLVVSTGFAVVRPSAAFLNPNFANYAFRNPSFLAEIEKRSIGVSYPAINSSDLADIFIHLPSLPRQRAIAEYLDRETARLDSLVAVIKVTISLLMERRATLIAAAVTGQLDIGEAA